MTHLSVPDERKQALGITDNLVRISIGVEDADDLIADFAQRVWTRCDLLSLATSLPQSSTAQPRASASRRSLPCGFTATGSSAHSNAGCVG